MKAIVYIVMTIFLIVNIVETSKAERVRASELWRKFQSEVKARTQRAFKCKQMFEECYGVPWQRCCGEMICYRETELQIYNPFGIGYCVECIDHGQICQRDSQCCPPLTCIKQKSFHLNGLCQPKLPSGERCIEDDDCKSKNCMKKFVLNMEGSCL